MGWRRYLARLEIRLVAARAEEQLSRDRLEQARAEVVRPLRKASSENQFAEMIWASLAKGHGKGSA